MERKSNWATPALLHSVETVPAFSNHDLQSGTVAMLAQATGWLRRQAALSAPCPALFAASRSLVGSQTAAGPPSRGEEAGTSTQAQGGTAQPQRLPPPALPPPSAQQQHWLDRHFPGVRHWLDEKNRKWWIKGLVQARCK